MEMWRLKYINDQFDDLEYIKKNIIRLDDFMIWNNLQENDNLLKIKDALNEELKQQIEIIKNMEL